MSRPTASAVSEQLVANRLADHADVRRSLDLPLSKGDSLGQTPSLDLQVFGSDPSVMGGPSAVAVYHRHVGIHLWRDALDQPDLAENGVCVFRGEAIRSVASGPHAVHIARSRLYPNQVVTQVVELLFQIVGAGLADRDHTDHRGDADCDSQSCQRAAQLVASQRAKGLRKET